MLTNQKNRFRPTLECLEAREVMSSNTLVFNTPSNNAPQQVSGNAPRNNTLVFNTPSNDATQQVSGNAPRNNFFVLNTPGNDATQQGSGNATGNNATQQGSGNAPRNNFFVLNTPGNNATQQVNGAVALSAQDTARIRAEILDLTNQERRNAGLPGLALVENPTLTRVAQNYTDFLARRQDNLESREAHKRDGKDEGIRVTEAGVRWSNVGEILARGLPGQPDAAKVVKQWMDSPEHKAVMLNPVYTQVGIGVASINGVPYYTQVFIRPM